MRRLLLLCGACVAVENRTARFEVPKVAVDFGAEGNATVRAACGPPARLGPDLVARLYFYAMVTADDPDLLAHFLAFYADLGVAFAAAGRARVVVHPPLNASRASDRRVRRLLADRCGAAYDANVRASPAWSSDLKRDLANELDKNNDSKIDSSEAAGQG